MLEHALTDGLHVLSNFGVREWISWLGLAFVMYKQLVTKNVVTFEANNPVREHRQRIFTALFYIPFVSIASFYVHTVMRIFIMIMIYQGMGEYIQIVFMDRKNKTRKVPVHYKFTTMDHIVQCLSLVPSIGFFYSYVFASALLYNIFFLIILIYLILLVFTPNKKMEMTEFYRIALYWFGVTWIAWPLSHAAIIFDQIYIDGVPHGCGILGVVLLASWTSDIAGYYVGKKHGKTKVIPHISPSKSAEGFVAQFVFGVGFCLFCWTLKRYLHLEILPPMSFYNYVFIGICISVLGAVGDILESFIKRMGGVKDSGIFFPGHGGILDRFDAFLLACPFTFYYILYFVVDGPVAIR